MALYEKRLQEDLTHIRGQVRTMGDMTEKVLRNAVHALLTRNQKLANETVLADHPINRQMREVDRLCHGFIARHLPSAGHLRLISSIIRLNIAIALRAKEGIPTAVSLVPALEAKIFVIHFKVLLVWIIGLERPGKRTGRRLCAFGLRLKR